jgi:hypothetical protein
MQPDAVLRMREIMGQLKLTVNEEKTRICKVPEETFENCLRNCAAKSESYR